MRKFNLARYFRNFFLLILIVTVLGTGLVYLYCKNNQQYTASVTIRYLNSNIKMGLAPDGSPFDATEIYSSEVISRAMDNMNFTNSMAIIRSRCYVSEVIEPDQQALNKALIAKGEQPDFHTDTYSVSLTVDGEMGPHFARNALDAIIRSYCSIYTEKYVERRISGVPSVNLLKSGYDYYECVRILDSDTTDILYYLSDNRTNYPDFRSSTTGYSFGDLYDIYNDLNDYMIPALYAEVLSGPKVKNRDYLVKSLELGISDSERTERSNLQRAEYLQTLIDDYIAKNKEIIDYHYANESGTTNDYVMNLMVQSPGGGKSEITYDELIKEYVELDILIRTSAISRANEQVVLNAIRGISENYTSNDTDDASMIASINAYEALLNRYFTIVSATSDELNQALSADYLKTLSSIAVHSSINTSLYVLAGFVFFLILGCTVAVVFGRIGDAVEFILYTDRKTGLPNRNYLDNYIGRISNRMLDDDFTCMFLRVCNISEISKRYGYAAGTDLLKSFAEILNTLSGDKSLVAYNDATQFVVLLEFCTEARAQTIVEVIDQQVGIYNHKNPDKPINYSVSCATTSADNIYSIRDLMRKASVGLAGSPIRDGKSNV